MSKQKRKCRQYSSEYLKYDVIPSVTNKQLPICLICEKTFTNEGMKPSGMIDHLKAKHPEKANKHVAYFRDLKLKFEKRPTFGALFKSCENEVEKGLIASYKVSKLIAKCGKSYNIGETLIIPPVKKIISTMMATQKDVVTLSMSCGENRYCVILFALFFGNRSRVLFVSYKLSSFSRDSLFRLIFC